tara:strand:- start:639 stop:770 length:132 start_codon:yes stop_codon:yes gene_type:complete
MNLVGISNDFLPIFKAWHFANKKGGESDDSPPDLSVELIVTKG